MNVGVLTHSIPAALPILACLCDDDKGFVIVLRGSRAGRLRRTAKLMGRLFLRSGRARSLKLLFDQRIVFVDPQSSADIGKLAGLGLDLGLHRSGIIYRQPLIDCFRLGILNAHIGILPRYRGRSVMEWAILEDGPVGITVFFVDAGIDTGERIVLQDEVDISHCNNIDDAKAYLFSLDAEYFRRALDLLRSPEHEFQLNTGPARRYYVMSGLFKQVVNDRLAK